MSIENKDMGASPDWHADDETLRRVADLLGIKVDVGMVLDFQEMEEAGALAECATTGAFAMAWLKRKIERVEYLMRPAGVLS